MALKPQKEFGVSETDDFGEIVTFNTENLSDAVLIAEEELKCLISLLQELREDNAQLLNVLSEEKIPYLFRSKDLSRLVCTTESLKTKINIIAIVGPRLSDPRAQSDSLIGLFKYAKHKDQVKEILKARAQIINSAMFNKASNSRPMLSLDKVPGTPTSSSPLAIGGRGGSGRGSGSGRGGRGRGRGTPDSRLSKSNPGTPRSTSVSSVEGVNLATEAMSYPIEPDSAPSTPNDVLLVLPVLGIGTPSPDMGSPSLTSSPSVPPAKSLDSGLTSAETPKQFPINSYRSPTAEKRISIELQRSLSKSKSDELSRNPSIDGSSSVDSRGTFKRRDSRIQQALHPEIRNSIETKSSDGATNENFSTESSAASSIFGRVSDGPAGVVSTINESRDSAATEESEPKPLVEIIQIANKSGFLKKKARNNCLRSWHTRYFELSYGKLAYYHSKEEAKDESKKVADFSLAYASIKEHRRPVPNSAKDGAKGGEPTATTVCVVFGSGEKDLELDAQSSHKASEWAQAIKDHSAYASGRAVSIV